MTHDGSSVEPMVDGSPVRASTDGPPRRRSTRKQDPERTRRALLAAAAEEFSTHGYDGARVTRIAAAAGVGHQLITYHFGGKKGLYDALQERWLERNEQMAMSAQPLARLAREYVLWVHEDEAWARTLIREALDGGFPISDERIARIISLVEQARIRQKGGDLRDDFDVGAIHLALLAATMAPVILPAFARAFVGLDPSSEAFAELYADQVARMMAALADPDATS
jgi:TetR/AcrR family transcriptional regulator